MALVFGLPKLIGANTSKAYSCDLFSKTQPYITFNLRPSLTKIKKEMQSALATDRSLARSALAIEIDFYREGQLDAESIQWLGALLHHTTSREPQEQDELIRLLGKVKNPPSEIQALIYPFLFDENPQVKRAAVRYFIDQKQKVFSPELITDLLASKAIETEQLVTQILGQGLYTDPVHARDIKARLTNKYREQLKHHKPPKQALAALFLGELHDLESKQAIEAQRNSRLKLYDFDLLYLKHFYPSRYPIDIETDLDDPHHIALEAREVAVFSLFKLNPEETSWSLALYRDALKQKDTQLKAAILKNWMFYKPTHIKAQALTALYEIEADFDFKAKILYLLYAINAQTPGYWDPEDHHWLKTLMAEEALNPPTEEIHKIPVQITYVTAMKYAWKDLASQIATYIPSYNLNTWSFFAMSMVKHQDLKMLNQVIQVTSTFEQRSEHECGLINGYIAALRFLQPTEE